MKKCFKQGLLSIMCLYALCTSCNKFINVVPDNVATIDFAFRLRSQALKALFTCYSYLPDYATLNGNVGFLGSDEMWFPPDASVSSSAIARGNQSPVNTAMSYWVGSGGAKNMYQGIRFCNVLLANIGKVSDMPQSEKSRWKAEAKFLKAYYDFYLIRMYGPIVIVKKNLPVSVSNAQTQRPRDPLDSCFSYVVQLLNEVIANPDLPDRILNVQQDLGRVDKAMAYALKAKVMVTWASPLFNGNKDYVGYTNKNGKDPFNTEFNPALWDIAAVSCKNAIDFVTNLGYRLFEFQAPLSLSGMDSITRQKLTIRQGVTAARGVENPGAIWVDPASTALDIQSESLPYGINPGERVNPYAEGRLGVPLYVAEMFYTRHGLPINADVTWDYASRYQLQKVGSTEKYNMHEGYTTAKLNFNREPRFYADLSFDGSTLFGAGNYSVDPDNFTYIQAKKGQPNGNHDNIRYSVTGYTVKKLLNYQTTVNAGGGATRVRYSWPVFRLCDLYLLYAEAKNEADGPGPEVYKYINLIRKRAGIPTVQDSWTNWSNDPQKYTTKEGMREIIHKERLIELAFEGQRFWDLRRWKEAIKILNQPVVGWDIEQSSTNGYYRKQLIFQQQFSVKDYLWPLNSTSILRTNTAVTQNPGW